MACFHISELADVMNRLITSPHGERRLSRPRESRASRKDRIENHASSRIAFAPHSEVARKHLPQPVAGGRVRLNREADRGCRSRVLATLHLTSELLSQDPRNQRQLAAAASHIERFETAL